MFNHGVDVMKILNSISAGGDIICKFRPVGIMGDRVCEAYGDID